VEESIRMTEDTDKFLYIVCLSVFSILCWLP